MMMTSILNGRNIAVLNKGLTKEELASNLHGSKLDYKTSSWDEEVYCKMRTWLYDTDHSESPIQKDAVEQKNKLDSENAEKARLAMERKLEDAELVKSQLRVNRQASDAFGSIKSTATVIEATFPKLVDFITSPSASALDSSVLSNSQPKIDTITN